MEKINIGSLASVIDKNNNLWMSNVFFNGLFQIDLNNSQIRFIGAFEDIDLSIGGLHGGAHINEHEIIFTPFYDQAIRIYHSNNSTYQTIAVPNEHKPPFSKSTRIGQHIYFLSEDGYIWNYDIETHTLIPDELSIEYQKFLQNTNGIIVDSTDSKGFLLLQAGGNVLCRINLIEHTFENVYIDEKFKSLEVPFYGNGKYWFFLNDSQDIISWDIEKKIYTSYRCKEERWGKDKFKMTPYAKMIFAEDDIFISNFNALYPVRINKERKNIEPIVEYLEGFHVVDSSFWGAIYTDVHIVGQDVYFIPCTGNLLLCYNRETGNTKTIEMMIPKNQISYANEILKDRLKKNVVLEGEDLYASKEFIKTIVNSIINNSNLLRKNDKNIGENIWKELIKE